MGRRLSLLTCRLRALSLVLPVVAAPGWCAPTHDAGGNVRV